MSDRGIPKSFRHMHGFGSHTYSFLNAANERIWVKFHFRTQQGIQNLTDAEAADTGRQGSRKPSAGPASKASRPEIFLAGQLFIQVMTDAQAKAFPFNPFDLTKVWPKGDFPLIEVGYFELNRNPENFFAEVEQAAFSPANIVPGIGFSPDKMLQGRLFSYGDAQRYRLGVNHHHIPVNAPKCPFHSYHRDGAMRTDGNLGRTPTYFPNSRGEWIDQPQLNEPPLEITGAAAHWDHRVDDDHYQQPGDLFRKMNPQQKQNAVRQHGPSGRRRREAHPGASYRQLRQGRSGLWCRRREGAGHRFQAADGGRGVGRRSPHRPAAPVVHIGLPRPPKCGAVMCTGPPRADACRMSFCGKDCSQCSTIMRVSNPPSPL